MSTKTSTSLTIYLEIEHFGADRTPYKLYNPIYRPMDMRVAVDIPRAWVVSEHEGSVALSMDGFVQLMMKLADTIDKYHFKE